MPVECDIAFKPVSQDEFHAVDKIVMRHAFNIHNLVGRFCDEKIYQEELLRRCRDSFEVHREVLLCVSHQDFSKAYYLDVLVNSGIIYELKTVETLHNSHQKQLINYLLLAGVKHGKLLNFRRDKVESRFVSTRLERKDRAVYRLIDNDWRGDDIASQQLRNILVNLLADWGVFLDANLYRDALLYFLGGSDSGTRPVDITIDGRIAGTQVMCVLNNGVAWHVSAARQHLETYKTHITRLLNNTGLEKIHWINFNQRDVTLRTIIK
jgi:GxxExxY protein